MHHSPDASATHEAAHTACIVVERSDRTFVRVSGRDPVRMVNGLLTSDVAALGPGQAVHGAMLTAKGRMLAELRVLRRADDLLLDTDTAALTNVTATLTRFVPPLFARGEDASRSFAEIGVYGPQCVRVVAHVLTGEPATSTTDLARDDLRFEDQPVHAIPTDYAGVLGVDLILPVDLSPALHAALVDAGAVPAGLATLDVLRIEAGQPRWGAELDETVIPIEAGLEHTMISMTKGCYTGQEVIIRILHRGHVNRHLRGILLGELAVPAAGTTLVGPDAAKTVGHVTSGCVSLRLGETIALGYVRREIEPGTALRLADPDGPAARIVSLPFAVAA